MLLIEQSFLFLAFCFVEFKKNMKMRETKNNEKREKEKLTILQNKTH